MRLRSVRPQLHERYQVDLDCEAKSDWGQRWCPCGPPPKPVGFTGRAVSGKFLVGDESNLNPKTDPYVLVNFVTNYAFTPKATIFGVVQTRPGV